MTSQFRSVIASITSTSLALVTVAFGTVIPISSANAAVSETLSTANVVRPGQTNATELVVSVSGLGTISQVRAKFVGATFASANGSSYSTNSSTFTNCGNSMIGMKTGASTSGASCEIGNSNFNGFWWIGPGGGATQVEINGSLSLKFAPGAITFNSSGPYSVQLQILGSLYSEGTVISLSQELPQQAPLSVTSTSGTFGTPLTLSTSGGTTNGAVTYSVTNGSSTTGCSVSNGSLTTTSGLSCLVTATMAGNVSYQPVSSAQTTVTFARASRTISFASTSLTIAYGSTDTVIATASAGTADGSRTYSHGTSTACTVNSSTGVVTATQASGTCVISATIAEGTSYLAASTSTSVTITTATKSATLTASTQTLNFGASVADPTISSSGLVSPDALSSVVYQYEGITPTVYAASITKPTNAGTYSVTPSAATFSTGSASNYGISYVAGTVTINRVSRTLSFGGSPTGAVSYGNTRTVVATPSAGDGAVTYTAGAGCTVNASTGEVTATGSSGSCAISASIAQGSNHLTASTTTSFTITLAKRPITVSATSSTVTVEATSSPSFTVSSGSLFSSDVISEMTFRYEGSGSTFYTSSTTRPTAVGTYSITPEAAVFSSGLIANYDVSYSAGVLTISAAAASGSSSPSSGGAAVVSPIPEAVKKVGLMKASNFTGGALPKKLRREIRASLRAMKEITSVVCTAFSGGSGDNPLSKNQARDLATKACRMVEKLTPDVEIKIRVRIAGNDASKSGALRLAKTGR